MRQMCSLICWLTFGYGTAVSQSTCRLNKALQPESNTLLALKRD